MNFNVKNKKEIDFMFEKGWIDEVKSILESGTALKIIALCKVLDTGRLSNI
jgi:hypothetical protein